MENSRKLLGVIGGLGPIATAYFMELVIRMTEAETDQEHLSMLVYNRPTIPDRTGYILDHRKPSPLPEMIRVGQALVREGAEYLAIPCITAHYFHEELTAALPVPLLHIVRETVIHLHERGVRAAGIMATDGTVTAGLFQQEMVRCGIRPVLPDAERQRDVMSLIYDNVKANRPVDMRRFEQTEQNLRDKGAEVVVLGCTELSMIKRDYVLGAGFIDAMEALAQQAVLSGGARLKPVYRDLITR